MMVSAAFRHVHGHILHRECGRHRCRRTAPGLTALLRSGCASFLEALFFTPPIGLVLAFATAPALILVGALMSEVGKIDFDFTNALPHSSRSSCDAAHVEYWRFGFISYTVMKPLRAV